MGGYGFSSAPTNDSVGSFSVAKINRDSKLTFYALVVRVTVESFQAAANGPVVDRLTRSQLAADTRLTHGYALVRRRVTVAIVGAIVVIAALADHHYAMDNGEKRKRTFRYSESYHKVRLLLSWVR